MVFCKCLESAETRNLAQLAELWGEQLLEGAYSEVSKEISYLNRWFPECNLPARNIERTSIAVKGQRVSSVRVNWRLKLFKKKPEEKEDDGIASGYVRKVLAREDRGFLVIVRLDKELKLAKLIENPFQRKIRLVVRFENPELIKLSLNLYHAIRRLKYLKCTMNVAKLLTGSLAFGSSKEENRNTTQFVTNWFSRPCINRVREILTRDDPVLIVEGPPGSGKTNMVASLAMHRTNQGLKVLVCTPHQSNVDRLFHLLKSKTYPKMDTDKYPHIAVCRITDDKKFAIPPKRKEPEYLATLQDSVNEHLMDHFRARHQEDFGLWANPVDIDSAAGRNLLNFCTQKHVVDARFRVLDEADIVVCTTWQAGRQMMRKDLNFDMLILDDAHLAPDIELLLPLVTGNLRQVVIFGQDLSKLTMIRNEKYTRPNRNLGYRKLGLFSTLIQDHGPHIRIDEQFRINPLLIKFCNDQYYGGQLRTHDSRCSSYSQFCSQFERDQSKPISYIYKTRQKFGLLNGTLCRILDELIRDYPNKSIGVVCNLDRMERFTQRKYRDIEVKSPSEIVGLEFDFVVLMCMMQGVACRRLSYEIEPDFTADEMTLHLVLTRPKLGLFAVVPDDMLQQTDSLESCSKVHQRFSQKWLDFIEYHRQLGFIRDTEPPLENELSIEVYRSNQPGEAEQPKESARAKVQGDLNPLPDEKSPTEVGQAEPIEVRIPECEEGGQETESVIANEGEEQQPAVSQVQPEAGQQPENLEPADAPLSYSGWLAGRVTECTIS